MQFRLHQAGDTACLLYTSNEPAIRPAVRQKLEKDRETAYMSRDLARIRLDAPVPTKMDAYLMRQPDEEKAVKTLNQLEMFSMITRLGLHLSLIPI